MQETTNLKLKKPDYSDVADIADINSNMDIIDENLGKVTVPTYIDSQEKKYADINGMHIRTDNSMYIKGGIKFVNADPCTDGQNLTEEKLMSDDSNIYVLAKIDEGGNAVFKAVNTTDIVSRRIDTGNIFIDGIALQRLAVRFKKAKGALFTDNSSGNASDGSRKFIFGVYKDTPKVDSNIMPTSLPNAGIITRVESDMNNNGTFVELYGDNIVCRNDNAVFKVPSIKADTIRAGVELKIGGNSVGEMLEKKANSDHSHSLTDESITNILPVSKGGTGSTTLTGARSNLGLGSASTKDVTTTVSNGNTNLVTSGAVFSAINNLKTNKRIHIVVASYDTKNPLKANADYICTSSNASLILKTAINATAQGGKVELLDGTYKLQYSDSTIELAKPITIEGSGYNTVIQQQIDTSNGEAKPIFNITGQNVTIKNMMLCDAEVSSPVSMIIQANQGTVYDGVFFIFNASESTSDNSCIEGKNNCSFTRIQNCRVFKGFNTVDKVMFDFTSCTNFGGVVGGNISSGYGYISIALKNENHKSNTAFYGHTNIDIRI